MRIIKNGNGAANHYADLATISFSLMSKSRDKNILLEKYLYDYKTFTARIGNFITQENLDTQLYFDNYTSSEHKKRIEKEDKGKKEVEYILEYYYIMGDFSLNINLINGNREVIAKLIRLVEDINKDLDISYHIKFTLQKETEAKVRAQATNNALDNIKIEVENIAGHLNKSKVELLEINFIRDRNLAYSDMAIMNKSAIRGAMTEAEKIELLDEMLESKDIEISSSFGSVWEVS